MRRNMSEGQRFGRWTVIEPYAAGERALVRCDCGREAKVARYILRNGESTQCKGCGSRQAAQRRATITLGMRFTNLTVVELLDPKPGTEKTRARVKCDCGRSLVVARSNLVTGNTSRCVECAARLSGETNLKHGHARSRLQGREATPEYQAWSGAKQRVANPNVESYPYYGGRGIGMADEWLNDFPAFLAHIGPRPGPGYSLDRIDVNGDYAPGNVRWATWSQQARNRRPRMRAAA